MQCVKHKEEIRPQPHVFMETYTSAHTPPRRANTLQYESLMKRSLFIDMFRSILFIDIAPNQKDRIIEKNSTNPP